MADFNAVIKFSIESATAQGGSGGAGGAGGAGGGPTDVTGAVVRTIKQLQDEFRNLSAQVRSVADSLEQIKNIQGATGSTGAPSGVSGTSPEVSALAETLAKVKGSAEEAAAATKEQTVATEQNTKAKKDEADAESELAGLHAAATRELEAQAAATKAATAATKDRIKALAELEGPNAVRRDATQRLNPTRRFEEVGRGQVASNPALREEASKSIEEILSSIKIPADATDEAKKEAKRFTKQVRSIIGGIFEGIEVGGGATGRQVATVKRSIRAQLAASQEQVGAGQAPTVDVDAIGVALASKSLISSIDKADASVKVFSKALAEGTDAALIASTKQKASADIAQANAAVASTARGGLFGTSRRTGREQVTGGAQIESVLKSEKLLGAASIPLTGTASTAFKGLSKSLKDLDDPLKSVRGVIKDLVAGGAGLDGLKSKLNGFIDGIKRIEQSDLLDTEGYPSREQFLNLQNIKKTLASIKIGEDGTIKGPAGAVDRDSSLIATQRAIQTRREALAQRAATAGPGQQVGGIKDDFEVNLPTASGGIKKVRIELQALGNTVDKVKVKAKDLGDNMFDRTSVRAALQRVAVWSTAASVVFGAFTALRQGLGVMIDTESALIGLSKVMNESSVDLQAFKSDAQEAALAIADDFGQPLEQVLETMILFGQQGKNLRETIALSKAAALASSVTTLDQPEAASALTAATQQFGLAFQDAESIVDKFNEVSNNAAVTETDLAQALKKAGQAAKNAGLDLDEFNGVVAAIAEQTRQSGNEIGTALRFIFSRLQTPEAEKGLSQVGISARDAAGNIRGFTPIIEDLASKFDTLSNSQKTQVAISIAGTRRFNTLLALLDNFSRFQDSAANSANSAGSALREQQKVTETATFRIEQLKNSLKELALSFGDSLLDPLKGAVGLLGTLVGALAAIPGPIKTIGASLAIGGLAFLKFTDHITDFLGLAGSVSGAGSVIGGSIRRNLTQGLSQESQISRFGADAFATSSIAVSASRAAPDFTKPFTRNKEAVSAFSRELSKSNLKLVTQRGHVLSSSKAFGKFGSIVRGFSVQSADGLATTALALGGLNSGLSRFGAFLGVTATKIATVIPGMSRAFDALDVKAASANSSSLALAGTLARFAAAAVVITAVVLALQALHDAAFESAEEVQRELEPEIQKRKEAILLLGQQEKQVKSLTEARRRAASVSSPGSFQSLDATQEQDVLSGRFKSTVVAIQKIRKQEQEAANSIGFANPELIDSMDEFGNVVLRSADSFDVLAEAAGNAQEQLLGLSQVKIVAAFADELKASEGLVSDIVNSIDSALSGIGLGGIIPDDAASNTKKRFDESLAEFKVALNDPIVKRAQDLGVTVSSINPGAADNLREAGAKFQRETISVRSAIENGQANIDALSPDSSQLVFQSLASKSGPLFEAQQKTLSAQGVDATVPEILNRNFLRNRSALAPVRGQIAETADLTIGNLRESGVSPQVIDTESARRDVGALRDELLKFSGGELILFKDVQGLSQQAIVKVTTDGKKFVEFTADDLGTFATKKLSDVIKDSTTNVQFIDTDAIKRQFTVAFQEIGRIVSGAGRGGILGRDLELGVNFRSELSGQQRASQGNELLFTDLQAAQSSLASFREGFGADAKEGKESTSKITDPENVAAVAKMALAIDELATAAKLSVEIEKVGIAFEKAADQIRNSKIEDQVKAQFSGILGASTGAIKRAFETPTLRQDLDPVAAADGQSQGFIELANALTRTQQANGDLVAGLLVAERNIGTFVRDFETSSAPGALRDPERLSDLARRSASLSNTGLDRAQSILTVLNQEQLSAQERANELLAHINANLSESPRLIGAALAQSALSSRGDDEGLAAVAQAVEAQSNNVSGFSSQDMQTLLSTIPATLISSVVSEFRASQTRGAASRLTTDLLRDNRQPLGIDHLNRLGDEGLFGETVGESAPTEVPKEAFARVATALETAIAEAITDAQFESILADPTGAARNNVDPAAIDNVLQSAITALESSGSSAAEQAAIAIKSSLAAGGDQAATTRNFAESAILSTASVGTPQELKIPEVAKSLQQVQAESLKLTEAMRSTIAANDALVGPLREVVGSFFAFRDAIVTVTSDLRGAVQKSIDDISVGRDTSQFTAPQVGLLAGVSLPGNVPDQRRNLSDLSGGELTALESPDLSRGLNEVNSAFEILVDQLGNVKRQQLDTQRALEGFQAEGNIKGVNLAKEALSQLGGISNLVEGQINSAQGTLKSFGEAFRDIESVNQLRVDVEKLVQSFNKEIELKFDRTSIATALGGTLFSATRPTFEQFEQGQSGFLTKFERSLASIDFQESSRTITPQEADRQRDKTTFERDEDIIALAQGKENEKLQAAVTSAEQIRSRLFDFVATGAPGAEAAQNLLDQITSELSTAGDIIPGGTASSIRDPRTGRQVDVPASAVNTFRGLPGLSGITQQLTQLSQDATSSTAQQNADLITQPLLTVLDQIPTKLDEVVGALKDATGLEDPSQAQQDLSANTDLTKELSRLLAPLQKEGPLSGSDVSGIVGALKNISNITPDSLARLLQTAQVSPSGEGSTQSLEEFLRNTLTAGPTDPDTRDSSNILAAIGSVFEQANQSSVARFDQLGGGISAFSTASEKTAEQFNVVSNSIGGADGMNSSVLSATEALTKFTSALTGGGLGDIFKSIGDKVSSFFGGGVQTKAQGGLITGPGGPTEDRVPLLASPGEFVINAKSASKIGIDRLNALNNSTGTISGDKRALGASQGFQEGGSISGTSRFERQQAARDAAREAARDPREKLKELQAKKKKLLESSPPKVAESVLITTQIANLQIEIDQAAKKRVQEAKRLEELRAAGVRQEEVDLEAETGGDIIIPDALIKTATRGQLESAERARQDKLAERRNTFQGAGKGGNFVRLSNDGKRYVFQGDSSSGAVDVAFLRGVSTNNPEELLAEIGRRRVFGAQLKSADADREKEKRAIQAEYVNLLEKEESSAPTQGQADNYGAGLVELQKLLQAKTNKLLGDISGSTTNAQDNIRTAGELLSGKTDHGSDDFRLIADELDKDAFNLRNHFDFIKGTSVSSLFLHSPPDLSTREDSGIDLRSQADASTVSLTPNLDGSFAASAFGQVIATSPTTEDFLSQILGSNLDNSAAEQAKELRAGSRYSAFRRRESVLKDGAKAIQSVRALLPDSAIGTAANAAAIALETSVSGVDLIAGEGIGQLGDLVSPERGEQLAGFTRGVQEVTAEKAFDAIKSPFAAIGENSSLLSSLKIKLESATAEGERRILKEKIAEAEAQLSSGLFNTYLLGRGGVSAATNLKNFAAPNFAFTKQGKAKLSASKHQTSSRARDAQADAQLNAEQLKGINRSGRKQALNDEKALRERADFLEARERVAAARDAADAAAASAKRRGAGGTALEPTSPLSLATEAFTRTSTTVRGVASQIKVPEALKRKRSATTTPPDSPEPQFSLEPRGQDFDAPPTATADFGPNQAALRPAATAAAPKGSLVSRTGKVLAKGAAGTLAAAYGLKAFGIGAGTSLTTLGGASTALTAGALTGGFAAGVFGVPLALKGLRALSARRASKSALSDFTPNSSTRGSVTDLQFFPPQPGLIGPRFESQFTGVVGPFSKRQPVVPSGPRTPGLAGRVDSKLAADDAFSLAEKKSRAKLLRDKRFKEAGANTPLLERAKAARGAELEIAKKTAGDNAIARAQKTRKESDIRRASNRQKEITDAEAQSALENRQDFAAREAVDSLDINASEARAFQAIDDLPSGKSPFERSSDSVLARRDRLDRQASEKAARILSRGAGKDVDVSKFTKEAILDVSTGANKLGIYDAVVAGGPRNRPFFRSPEVAKKIREQEIEFANRKKPSAALGKKGNRPAVFQTPEPPAPKAPTVDTPSTRAKTINEKKKPSPPTPPTKTLAERIKEAEAAQRKVERIVARRTGEEFDASDLPTKAIDDIASGANKTGSLSAIIADIAPGRSSRELSRKLLLGPPTVGPKGPLGKVGNRGDVPSSSGTVPTVIGGSPSTLLDELLGATGAAGTGFGAAFPVLGVLGRRALGGLKGLFGGPKKAPAAPAALAKPFRPDNTGKVLSVDPELQGLNRNRVSTTEGLSFAEAQSQFKKALDEGFTLEEFSSRKLEPIVPEKFQFGIEGDRGIIAARVENLLRAPKGSIPASSLGPNLIEKFLDVSAEEALDVAAKAKGPGLKQGVSSRKALGGSNIQQIFDELSPIIEDFKAGKGPLPDKLEVKHLRKGPSAAKPNIPKGTPSVEELLKLLQNPDDIPKFAIGGKITGPGGPTSDRIPILTSPGEFVLNANAVGKIGLPVIESMNRTGILPKFQHGGVIDDDEFFNARQQILPRAAIYGASKTPGEVLPSQGAGIDVAAAFKSLIKSPSADNSDVQLLSDLSEGKKAYINPRTGETVTASQFLDAELRAKGFEPDTRPLSQLLSGSLLQGSDGSLTLLAPGDTGVAGPRTIAERKEANAEINAQVQRGVEGQRLVNANLNEEIQRQVLVAKGLDPDLAASQLAANRGQRGAGLQGLLDEAELEEFGQGGLLRRKKFGQGGRIKRRFGGGGLLSGPGGPKSDDIPILASNGEFILNSEAAGKLGLPTLEELNTTGKLPGFQSGGDVSGRSSGGVSINTEEITAAIKNAFAQAAEETSVTIDASSAADSITSAVTSALSNIEFPKVKLDASSLAGADLGNSLGAAVQDRLKSAEGSITFLKESTNELLDGMVDVVELKSKVATQEESILNAVEFRINQENDSKEGTSNNNSNIDKEVLAIRTEMLRIEDQLIKVGTQASLALSKALTI